MSEALMDGEGENMAVRRFLMQYGVPGLTVGAMKRHMANCGHPHWPAWVDDAEGEHLTKAGAQLWLRHLFALEPTSAAGATNPNDLTSSPEPAPALRAAPMWEPAFDAMSPSQERLAIDFCTEIAGRRGAKGSPPDPVRLLEMAEALYLAERDDSAPPLASGLLPVAREGLSDEQIDAAFAAARKDGQHLTTYEAARAIEAAHGIAPASGDAPGEAK